MEGQPGSQGMLLCRDRVSRAGPGGPWRAWEGGVLKCEGSSVLCLGSTSVPSAGMDQASQLPRCYKGRARSCLCESGGEGGFLAEVVRASGTHGTQLVTVGAGRGAREKEGGWEEGPTPAKAGKPEPWGPESKQFPGRGRTPACDLVHHSRQVVLELVRLGGNGREDVDMFGPPGGHPGPPPGAGVWRHWPLGWG